MSKQIKLTKTRTGYLYQASDTITYGIVREGRTWVMYRHDNRPNYLGGAVLVAEADTLQDIRDAITQYGAKI